jgi:hypothetical protein
MALSEMSGTVLPNTMWKASMLSTGDRSNPSAAAANSADELAAKRLP